MVRMNNQTLSLSFSPNISGEGDVPSRFMGTAYSGGVIPQYGSLRDVIIDLASMKAPSKPVFALVNHDSNQRAGKCELSNTGSTIEVLGSFSLSTPSGQQVAAEFAEGAPFEFSVGLNAQFESFTKPKTVEVNGQSVTVNGVFRNASVREVSFVPAGADPNTKAIAFESNTSDLFQEDRKQMEDVNELLCELKEMLNLPTLATADEIKAELNKMFSQLAESAQSDPKMGMAGIVTQFAALQHQSSQIDDLNAKLAAEVEQSKALLDRANALESELKTFKASVREDSVKALFADLNKDYSETAALAYLTMSDEMFAAVATDLRSLKPVHFNSDLFKETAVKGKETATETSLAAQLFNQVAGVK